MSVVPCRVLQESNVAGSIQALFCVKCSRSSDVKCSKIAKKCLWNKDAVTRGCEKCLCSKNEVASGCEKSLCSKNEVSGGAIIIIVIGFGYANYYATKN